MSEADQVATTSRTAFDKRYPDYGMFPSLARPSNYRDRTSRVTDLSAATTLYVGNLSFYTTEEQVYVLFSMVAPVRRVVMGLDRNTRTPCGFCFVEYYTHEAALECLLFISGTKLDERVIRCDLDVGFKEGRQWGRGRSGGQVRDEYREDFDTGRGGWGKLAERQQQQQRRSPMRHAEYPHDAPPSTAQPGETFDRFRED
ncbi:nuclear cap binding complex subunit [Savitreella phatthalungensis]